MRCLSGDWWCRARVDLDSNLKVDEIDAEVVVAGTALCEEYAGRTRTGCRFRSALMQWPLCGAAVWCCCVVRVCVVLLCVPRLVACVTASCLAGLWSKAEPTAPRFHSRPVVLCPPMTTACFTFVRTRSTPSNGDVASADERSSSRIVVRKPIEAMTTLESSEVCRALR
eukprot:804886-Prymnesium_polylepis.3